MIPVSSVGLDLLFSFRQATKVEGTRVQERIFKFGEQGCRNCSVTAFPGHKGGTLEALLL